jgi:thiosulfate/3-mercaptopyruvate sulfurtransferase
VGPLVDTAWLEAHLGEADLRVVDVRWYLDPACSGREAWRAGHIPGAVFLDVDRDLSAPGGARGAACGRHPWPPAEQVGAVMGRAGVSATSRVVAYDDAGGSNAARVWYLLRAHGHECVAVLDGGLARWLAEGRPIARDEPAFEPAAFRARLRSGFVLGKEEMADAYRERLVLDARAPERYRGEVEPVDPRPGRIPGARSAPWEENLTDGPEPVFRPPDELRRLYVSLGADREVPVVYCGSGVTACHDLLALHIAGLRGVLYGGSWSEWCADPALPAEVG